MRCAKSRLFSDTGSHRSQGPEFCTLQPLLVHHGSDACHQGGEKGWGGEIPAFGLKAHHLAYPQGAWVVESQQAPHQPTHTQVNA